MIKLLCIMALVFGASSNFGVGQFRPTNSLQIHAMGGWYLILFYDGSGNVGYGSSGGDAGFFPKGTFSLDQIFQRIKPSLKIRQDGRYDWTQVRVDIMDSDYIDDARLKFTTSDFGTTKNLFEDAFQKIPPFQRNHLVSLVAKCPLFRILKPD